MGSVQVPTSAHPLYLSLNHFAAIRGFDSLLDRLLTRFTSQAKNIDQRPGSALVKQVGMETDFKGRLPLHMACARGMCSICSIVYMYIFFQEMYHVYDY